MVSIGDVLAGRYRIDAPLGAGGMATVHQARDLLLARDVAVKVLAPNIAAMPTVLERFGREARALAALNHPNIVAVHDVGWTDANARTGPFLVMELVPGGTLAQHIATNGPLAPPVVAELVDGLASALAALHRAGVVHRDVKPQNVLLSPSGAKLADLGVIRLEDETGELAALTSSGETIGTLRFLAPEVLYGQPAGPKADAFGLGVVAFEALTGRSARPAVTVGDLVDSAWQPPPLVSEARPELGTRFDALFAAVLELDPNRRLDVRAFATALRRAATTRAGHDDPTEPVRTPIAAAGTAVPRGREAAPSRGQRWTVLGIVAALAVAILLAAIMLVAVLPGLFAGAGVPATGDTSPTAAGVPATPASAAPPGSSASGSPLPSPTPSPSATPTATPSPVPTAESLDAAYTNLRAAISLARGSGGLKGGDAKSLDKAVDEIQRAAIRGDMARAVSLATDLVAEVDRLIEKGSIEDSAAERLRTTSGDLLRLLEGD